MGSKRFDGRFSIGSHGRILCCDPYPVAIDRRSGSASDIAGHDRNKPRGGLWKLNV